MLEQRQALVGPNATLYYPWILRRAGRRDGAGVRAAVRARRRRVYAATDRRVGVHKAPANEVVEGALDLELAIT